MVKNEIYYYFQDLFSSFGETALSKFKEDFSEIRFSH